MDRFTRFLANPFADRHLSVDVLQSFSTDLLQRLISRHAPEAGPDSDWSERIDATRAAFTAFDDAITADLTWKARRKAAKMVKTRFRRRELPRDLRRVEAFVVARFGHLAAQVRRCLPDGRNAFLVCPDDALDEHLASLVAGLEALSADLDPAALALGKALRDQWAECHAASESATAAKALAEQTLRKTRRALLDCHYRTLLTIAVRHPDQPEKLSLYMQPSLLRSRKRRGKRA